MRPMVFVLLLLGCASPPVSYGRVGFVGAGRSSAKGDHVAILQCPGDQHTEGRDLLPSLLWRVAPGVGAMEDVVLNGVADCLWMEGNWHVPGAK